MAERFTEYNETTDLYLEILREAQRIEDKKIIEIVRNRLRHVRQPACSDGRVPQIITFPRQFIPPCRVLKESGFWPKQAYTQIALILAGYFLMLTGHMLIR